MDSLNFLIDGELYSMMFAEEDESGEVSVIEDEPMDRKLRQVLRQRGYPYDREQDAWHVTLEQLDDVFRQIWEEHIPDEEYPGASVLTIDREGY